MKKKQQKIQIALISIGLLLIFLTYFYYPYIKKSEFLNNKTTLPDVEDSTDEDQSTSFENVEYAGLYNINQPFTIKSEKAHMLNEDPDLVYMTKMHVTLYLSDSRIVTITSDRGKYNKITHDCFFEQNVKATDDDTVIFAENLDLVATSNSVDIYNDVYLKHATGSLQADKINYDFETKYFKVSMFDDKAIKMKVIK